MAINLGNIFSSGGKTVIAGGGSGLDIEGLVKSLGDAKRLPATRLEDTITLNGKKSDALSELSNLLDTFRSAVNVLRNPPGVGNQASNVFKLRSGSVSSNTGISGDTYLTTAVSAGANPGNYAVTVDQLATRQTRVTSSFALADLNTQAVDGGGPFNAGTLTLGANGTTVTLDSGDTLSEVLGKVNAVKSTSGVEMTALEVTPGNFQMVFKATKTGTDQNFDFDAANPGILNVAFASQTDAVDAKLTIDGVQVTRQSNSISDALSGVTFNLKQTTPLATNLTLDVGTDPDLVKSAILNMVDAYNAFRVFAAQQAQTNDDGGYVDGAVLGASTALRSLVNSVGSEVSSLVNGLGSAFDSLSDIGITLTDFQGDDETPFTRNILQVDETKLASALASNFEDVQKIFEFSYTVDNPNMVVYSRTNALNATSITFNIDQTNGVYEATYDNGSGPQTVTLDMTVLTSGGVSLTGPAGSGLEGLNVLFTDTADATVTMNLTQGLGDRFYNLLDDALDEDSGLVATEVTSLNERNDRLQEDIDRIDVMVEAFRNTLLERFSALEAALSSVNSILQMLDAQAEARANG